MSISDAAIVCKKIQFHCMYEAKSNSAQSDVIAAVHYTVNLTHYYLAIGYI